MSQEKIEVFKVEKMTNFTKAFAEKVKNSKANEVHLDLTGVDWVNSSFIGVMLWCKDKNITAIVKANSYVDQCLKMIQVQNFIKVKRV